MSNERLAITPLGGVGYVGRNSFLFQTGRTGVLADYGLDPAVFARGDNSIIPPERSDLIDEAIKRGVDIFSLLTHYHLDHVGAVGGLLARGIKDERLIMSGWTSDFLDLRQDSLGIQLDDNNLPWEIIKERRRRDDDRPDDYLKLQLGDFTVIPVEVNHSAYGAFCPLLIGGGRKIFHLTDFKFYGYLRNKPDNNRIMRDGRRWFENILLRKVKNNPDNKGPIDCLLLDVLNSDLPDFTPPEEDVVKSLEKIIQEAPGRVFISCISSNLQRIEEIIKMLKRLGKTYAVVGRSMRSSLLMIKRRLYNAGADLPGDYNEADVIFLTGSQGEENAAIQKMLDGGMMYGRKGEEKLLEFLSDDWVVFLSRLIPGSEEKLRNLIPGVANLVAKVIIHLGETAKIGLPVGVAEERFTHVSGHEQLGGLGRVLEILEPKLIVPIHATWERVAIFERAFGSSYNIRRLQAGETLEI